jgi:thymidylate synthase (FAD)
MTSNAQLIDLMGNDLTVVNAARVSMDKWSDEMDDRDAKLIGYLAKHNHWTPFAHPQATFLITAPIFVARQLAKHQIGLVWNEVSRRYVDTPPEYWLPHGLHWRDRPQGSIKQGSGDGRIPVDDRTIQLLESALVEYHRLVSVGVAPEMARAVLPLACYTQWHWTGSLYAFSRVYKLRTDSHAQHETGVIAQRIGEQLAKHFPVSWSALTGDNA